MSSFRPISGEFVTILCRALNKRPYILARKLYFKFQYIFSSRRNNPENGLAVTNMLSLEVMAMLPAVWLMLSTMLYSLQLNTGTFPKPLTEAEERHYLALSAQGDLQARNILIERNLRLVAHIMKKYYAQTSDQEDLISIGTIGLIKGITTFDASKGARLATYAARCVENAILTPTTLRVGTVHPKALNGQFGAF